MKIAYILSTCGKWGPFIVACDIINNLPGDIEPVDIFYLKESDDKLPFKGRLHKVSLGQRTDFSQYDVVHSHGFLGDVYGFLNRRSMKGKWITTLHQKVKPDYSMAYNKLIGTLMEIVWVFMVSRSACIACITNEMADYYQRLTKRTKIVGVHNGISPKINNDITDEEANRLSSLHSQYTVMGISANVIYRKGIDVVVRALAHPGAEKLALVVIGDGKDKGQLTELSRTLGVHDRVYLMGYRKNAVDYFKYFHVYMMSSRSEGFGLCVMEAAAANIPVVCNDLSVYRELFDDEVVRFPLDDPKGLIDAVRRANAEHEKFSRALHKKYVEEYTAERMSANYLQLYRSIAAL